MGDNEDYTFSSVAKRKPKKLRIKKTYMNDDDDAVGTSDEPRTSTPPAEPTAFVSPEAVPVPPYQSAPRKFQNSTGAQRRQLAMKSRLKRYQKDDDEVVPAVSTFTSGDSSLDSSVAISTGDGSSDSSSDSSSGNDEAVPNSAGSFPYTNPQDDSRSRNVHQGNSKSSSVQEYDASLHTTTMEEAENDSDSDDSDSESDEMEDEESEEEEDGTLAKPPSQRYVKYRSVLGRSSSSEEMWEKPKSKLGAPPSFDYDPSQQRQKASMFGGTSDVESSAYKLPPGALEIAKPKKPKSRGNLTDSPVPVSKILDKEDMAVLTNMLCGDSSDDDDISDELSFPSKDDSEVVVSPKTSERNVEVLSNEDPNQVQAAMSEDVDMADDDVYEEVSYYSSEIQMSDQGERGYDLEVLSGSFEEELTHEEGDGLTEIEQDDAPNHRVMMSMAAMAGAAAAKRSSQRDVEEVIESIAAERDEPTESTHEQSESTVPVSERLYPAKKESEEHKSEASAIAAAVAGSGFKSNLVHKEVDQPAPKEEPKVERMVQLKAVPKPDPKALNDDEELGGFQVAKDPARTRMSQFNRDEHSDNITNNQGDDDDFSGIWEQSVVEENKGRPRSPRAMGYSDGEFHTSRNTGEPSLPKNEADSTANFKNEGKEAEGSSLASSKSTGKDADASSPTSAKGAGKEADSQANEKNGGKEAVAGYALASTTRPPSDTPQDWTFQQNGSDSSDSSGSMDLDFGNGPLQTGDDDNSMDSFSMGASKDIESLATSKYDKEEYKPKRSASEASLTLDEMEAMNTGMQCFEGLSDSDLGKKMEADPVDTPDKTPSVETPSVETKSSSATALRKPTFYSGARRNCLRGTMILLLLAAGAVPTYFLITGQEARADKNVQSVELFGALPTASPSQSPVVDTMQPQPTSAPGSPTMQPVAPTPSPTTVPPRPTTQSPSMQSETASPSQSPSLRPTTLSPTPSPTINPLDFLDEFLTAASPDLQAAFTDTTSPQYSALLWLSTDPKLFSYPDFKIIQRFALATFYLTTGGNTWTNNDAWLTDVDECLWYSSSTNIAPCDFMGLFVNLELELNNIGGTLPAELSLLSNSLTRIDLTRTGSQNFLSGPIPPEFGQLTKFVYFSLRGNQITGSLPPTLGQWTLLEVADLSNNLLSGPLPEASGMLSQLSILDFDGNQLTGTIPTTIGRLTKIRNISIANNRLTGPIPSEIGRLFLLEDLNLERNELTTLPAELGNLILLRFFSVSKNNIAGMLPPQIGSLINVLTLDLSENALSGAIPTEMGGLFLIRGMLSICVVSFSLLYRSSLTTQCLCFEQIL
jgi:hypothetical protein